jgi:hypothetical protein
VRRAAWAWFFLSALGALALGLARLLAPGRFELELDVYILASGGLALLLLAGVARDAYPLEGEPEIARALQRDAEEPQRPAELERLERELTMATATAFDLHVRLRPLLRQVAGVRLAARGVRLEDGEAVLGEELWQLVRADAPPPTDRNATGIDPAALRRAVDALEAL